MSIRYNRSLMVTALAAALTTVHAHTNVDKPKPAPKVWNKHHRNAPLGAVYIGRGSPWGNPWVIGEHGTRAQVIRRYEEYVLSNPDLQDRIRKELHGKDLVCFCAPHQCHGDVLLRIANEE